MFAILPKINPYDKKASSISLNGLTKLKKLGKGQFLFVKEWELKVTTMKDKYTKGKLRERENYSYLKKMDKS